MIESSPKSQIRTIKIIFLVGIIIAPLRRRFEVIH